MFPPLLLYPQQKVPPEEIPQECSPPTAATLKVIPPADRRGVSCDLVSPVPIWPNSLVPQQYRAEADVRAQVVEIFALREIAPAITVTPVDPRPVDVSALISACPAATAVMIPVELTVAIAGAEEDQVTVPVLFVTDSWVLRPARSVTAAGVSSSWASGPDELSHAPTRALKTAVMPKTNRGRTKDNTRCKRSIPNAKTFSSM
jgi:hypothetical protein